MTTSAANTNAVNTIEEFWAQIAESLTDVIEHRITAGDRKEFIRLVNRQEYSADEVSAKLSHVIQSNPHHYGKD